MFPGIAVFAVTKLSWFWDGPVPVRKLRNASCWRRFKVGAPSASQMRAPGHVDSPQALPHRDLLHTHHPCKDIRASSSNLDSLLLPLTGHGESAYWRIVLC